MFLLPLYTFPFFLKVVPGLYLADVLLFFVVIYRLIRGVRISRELVVGILCIATLALVMVMLSVLNLASIRHTSLEYYSVPLRLISICFYLIYFTIIPAEVMRSIFLYLCLMFPVAISFFAYFNEPVQKLMQVLWSPSTSPTWRYGGLFGDDVNSFGMYCTLMILISFVLYIKKNISFVILVIGSLVSFQCVLLSGMRTGFIGLMSALILVGVGNLKLSCVSLKGVTLKMLIPIVIKTLFLFVAVMALWYYIDVSNIVKSRFGFDALLNDFDSGGNGNLAVAIDFFNSSVNKDLTISDILFGVSPAINYVDNLYIYIFLKYGILFDFILICYIAYLLYYFARRRNRTNCIGFFLVLLSVIFAMKGVFPLGGYYVYLCFYAHGVWSISAKSLEVRAN